MKIWDLEPVVALHAMRAGLRVGPFLDSLSKRPAFDIDYLRRRASKYINMEEAREAKKTERVDNQDKRNNQTFGKRLASRIEVLPKLYEPRGLKYAVNTPLNTARAQILDEVCHVGFVEYPPPSTAPESANRRRYFRFHNMYGHATEDCIEWKDQMEELVQMGQLADYMQWGGSRRQTLWGGYGGRDRGNGGKGNQDKLRIDQTNEDHQVEDNSQVTGGHKYNSRRFYWRRGDKLDKKKTSQGS